MEPRIRDIPRNLFKSLRYGVKALRLKREIEARKRDAARRRARFHAVHSQK